MPLISALVRSLGTEGAVANVQAALDARRREAWVVAGVALRVERRAAQARAQHERSNDADARAVV